MRSRGFTLVELVITVAVAGVLLAVAIPSFTQTISSNRLTATANQMVAGLTTARIEAIRRNAVLSAAAGRTSVQFCSNTTGNNTADTLGTACGTSAGAVYVLEPDGTTTTMIQSSALLTSDMSLADGSGGTTAVKALRFNGTGQASLVGGTAPYTGLVADVLTSRINAKNHRCIYLTTGSFISTCTNTGTCSTTEPTTCAQ